MRRRCCCSTPIPGDCFDFWDTLGGASDQIGSTCTFNWSGLQYGNFVSESGVGIYASTFRTNPNIYPTFSPSLTSGSVELEYIGTTYNNCVWHGSYPVTVTFPFITLPDDYKVNGTGTWSNNAPVECRNQKYTKQFSSISLVASFRLVVSKTFWPYFTGELILSNHYSGYDPLTGTYATGYGKFDWDKYSIDDNDCTMSGNSSPAGPGSTPDCTGFSVDGQPIPFGRIFIGPVNSLGQTLGFTAGKGGNPFVPFGSFVPNIIFDPADLDFANHKLTVNVSTAGLIRRYMCLPDILTRCVHTFCNSIEFSFGLFTNRTPPFQPGEGYIEW